MAASSHRMTNSESITEPPQEVIYNLIPFDRSNEVQVPNLSIVPYLHLFSSSINI